MQTLKSTGLCLDARAAPGNKFVDVSRYHHTITNNNVVTVKGMGDSLGGGYNGTTSYLDCGNHSSLNISDAITIEAWIKTTTSEMIIQKYNDLPPYEGYGLRISTDQLRFFDGTAWRSETTTDITDNIFHHVCFTGSGTAGVFYIDGVSKTVTTFSIIPDNAGEILYVGAIEGAGGFFDGIIDNIRIYNRALPAYEILDHYYEYATLLGLD